MNVAQSLRHSGLNGVASQSNGSVTPGAAVGASVGVKLGPSLGESVIGDFDTGKDGRGKPVGIRLVVGPQVDPSRRGSAVGESVGVTEGTRLGTSVGHIVGVRLGS